MSMLEWAKNEIAIASKRERGDKPEGEWDYGCACYDSALRAFESLLGDGHSGMSIGFTKNILNRLIDGKPLTPIEDTEEAWGEPRIDSRDQVWSLITVLALFQLPCGCVLLRNRIQKFIVQPRPVISEHYDDRRLFLLPEIFHKLLKRLI